MSVDCSECIHKRICEIWRSKEAQDASCYVDDCAYCKNDQCYGRGGRDCCNPIWRGRDNPSVTAKP